MEVLGQLKRDNPHNQAVDILHALAGEPQNVIPTTIFGDERNEFREHRRPPGATHGLEEPKHGRTEETALTKTPSDISDEEEQPVGDVGVLGPDIYEVTHNLLLGGGPIRRDGEEKVKGLVPRGPVD